MFIITIDGPAACGKGTVAKIIASYLDFNYLDSGAIYRTLSYLIWQKLYALNDFSLESMSSKDLEALALELISQMDLTFNSQGQVIINAQDVTQAIRTREIGVIASKIAALPYVRESLLEFQRSYARGLGLVTDGRDMGTVIFPQANLKVFLTASLEIRAKRRFDELHKRDKSVKIMDIQNELLQRDLRDSNRECAPLRYDNTFKVLDNSYLTIDETVNKILLWFEELKS